MKRCPECEFLYEDEQERCDMDGTVLRFTSFLPPLTPPRPVARPAEKSIWGGLTIPLLALVIIGTIVMILYRATPSTFSSSSGLKHRSGSKPELKSPASDTPHVITAPVIAAEAAEEVMVSQARPKPNAVKTRQVAPADESPILVAPFHVRMEPVAPVNNVPKPVTSQPSPGAAAGQKPSATSYSITAHPAPPPASPVPQSKPQSQNKESGFKSLLKKAGRVLKKPF